jgi:hypothetical protein
MSFYSEHFTEINNTGLSNALIFSDFMFMEVCSSLGQTCHFQINQSNSVILTLTRIIQLLIFDIVEQVCKMR